MTYANDQHQLPGIAAATLCEAFALTVGAMGAAPALRALDGTVIGWDVYAERVRRLAGGLAGLGVSAGDAVALMLRNRPEFHLLDCAALHLGATPFSIYNTSAPEQIAHVLANAGSRVVICEAAFLSQVVAAGAGLDHLVVVDAVTPGTIVLDDLESGGDSFDLGAGSHAVSPDDVATLIYTSGTTGPPKGVEVTHSNILSNWRAATQALPLRRAGRLVSYLPLAHIADRFCAHYAALVSGSCVTCVGDPAELRDALLAIRPTSFGAVPRTFQKWHAELLRGRTSSQIELRTELGLDQADWVASGAAPIAPAVLEAFATHGLTITEVFGMSELGCIVCANPPDAVRVGSVGLPLPGVEVKLGDDGELLVRSPSGMRRYRNDPQRTLEAFDDDGYLRTGDLAAIDAEGYVTVVDRKKDLIINAAGKNMSPVNIEKELENAGDLIDKACAIGDSRPYNVALLTLDHAAAVRRRDAAGDLVAQVQAEVDRANARLSRVEQIKRFAVLEQAWLPGVELTPTLKLKRQTIAECYAAEIAALYEEAPCREP